MGAVRFQQLVHHFLGSIAVIDCAMSQQRLDEQRTTARERGFNGEANRRDFAGDDGC